MGAPDWSCLHSDLAALHAAALASADPIAAVSRQLALRARSVRIAGESLPLSRDSRIWLVAAGKAARGMATAAVQALDGRLSGGVVVHPHGSPAASGEPERLARGVQRLAASHPLPDAGSLAAGDAVRRLLVAPQPQDLLVVLLSGGASSLLESPAAGISLATLREMTSALLRAGADIAELNVVRRALSGIKGGGLARWAAPARIVTLALSDVVGDRPEAIGSGPTIASPTGAEEALGVLVRRELATRWPEVVAALRRGRNERPPATAEPGLFRIVGSNRDAAQAVARVAAERGFRSQVMTTFLHGEAREAGYVIGSCARSIATHGLPFAAPACLIFGGETTVTVRGNGRGGRNQELALGAALAISGADRSAVFSFATDGVDGNSDAAGAIATGDSVARAGAAGLSARQALEDNDTGTFFAALGDSWRTGPTGTNVNDLALALAYPRASGTRGRTPAR